MINSCRILGNLLFIIDLKTGGYEDVPINAIIFSFGIRSGLAPLKGIQTDVKYQNYHHFKFPITMDPLKYGNIITSIKDHNAMKALLKNLFCKVLCKAGRFSYGPKQTCIPQK